MATLLLPTISIPPWDSWDTETADQFHGSDFVRERGSTRTIIGKQRQYFGFSVASECTNKLFARQIWILAFAFFDSATTICKYKNGHFLSLSAYQGNS
jgi:hypothetical protein